MSMPSSTGPGEEPTLRSTSSSETGSNTSSSSRVTVLAGPGARPPTNKWVRFDGEASISTEINGAPEIPPPEEDSVGVAQIAVSIQETKPGEPQWRQAVANGASYAPPTLPSTGSDSSQQPYENGKVVTCVNPENELCPWILPARFNSYKMPKSLVSDKITMPVEDFVTSMEMLTNDFRFRGYTVCYRRLIASWLVVAFLLLMVILVTGLFRGMMLFGVVLIWMFLVAVGVLVCIVVKKQINKNLHRCVQSVNSVLMKYNLLVGIEDTGKLSCHKIAIHFVYFKTDDCLTRIEQLLSHQEQMLAAAGRRPAPVTSVSGDLEAPTVPSSRGRARMLLLKYSQSYVRAAVRRSIRFPSRPSEGVSEFAPLHCPRLLCLCQYLQRHHFDRRPKSFCQRFCLVGELSIGDLEAPYGAGSYPAPAAPMYAHM